MTVNVNLEPQPIEDLAKVISELLKIKEKHPNVVLNVEVRPK